MALPDPDELIRFHDGQLAGDKPLADADALMSAIADNHRCNRALWDEEDLARRTDVPADYIVGCKRRIDRHNQQRNDAIEHVDAVLLDRLSGLATKPTARLHSETPGAIIDRLSILSLKIHHMRLQTQRTDADAAHLSACDAKLQRLQSQRSDLADCLARLFEEIRRGEAFFKAYRQYKMYNDPALNPWLGGKPPGKAG